MWERLRRFRKLSSAARIDFLLAAFLLPVISVSLRICGFRNTQMWLQNRLSKKDRRKDGREIQADAAITARMVRAATRYGVGHPTCLAESLALWWLLARRGQAPELRIGVRKTGEKFEAHAWVEHECQALNEPEAPHRHYAVIDIARENLPPEQQ
jgi:hypothetical protein